MEPGAKVCALVIGGAVRFFAGLWVFRRLFPPPADPTGPRGLNEGSSGDYTPED